VKDPFRYQLVDEPRPGPLSRFALPPILVFLAAQFFLPWGFLLLAANSVALNGPGRNREILFSLIPIGLYYLGLAILDTLVRGDILEVNQAHYFFVIAIGTGLMFSAFAYVSQHQTAELRQYLSQGRA
jgi:hypothetical protein